MNKNSEMQELLYRFIQNQCSLKEIEKVENYFKENKLTEDFPEVDDVINYLGQTKQIDDLSAQRIILTIMSKDCEIKEKQSRRRNVLKFTSIAASIVILISAGWIFQNNFFKPELKPFIDPNAITLELSNGEIQVVASNKKSLVIDSDGNVIGNQYGNKIVYNKTNIDKLIYNTIKIPYGKRFELQLSDGTIVNLNSGTTFKYPIKFIDSQKRTVFLDGEAFFKVAKDKKHPFIVNADNLNVRVLGTHFNVSNYAEEKLTDVVLLEGSVGLYSANEKFDQKKNTILKPGFKASFSKSDKQIKTKSVDTNIYISWINGGLTFREMTFKDISKQLERHYNITIINQNTKLSEEKFNASFSNEPIEKVLSYFNEIHGIHYKIKNNHVLIN
jgi:hypothetical protein|nr:FecR domain-containing protein [uncultured Flavobacterium sp.]